MGEAAALVAPPAELEGVGEKRVGAAVERLLELPVARRPRSRRKATAASARASEAATSRRARRMVEGEGAVSARATGSS